MDSSKVGEPLNLVVLRGDRYTNHIYHLYHLDNSTTVTTPTPTAGRVFKIAAMPADLATFLESQNRVNQPTPGRAQETPRMLPQQP